MDKLITASDHWDDACLRIESFLRANGLGSRERRMRLTLDILEEARRLQVGGDSRHPVAIGMACASARVDAWFLDLAEGDPERLNRVRVAAFAEKRKAADRDVLFSSDPTLLRSIRSATVVAGPTLDFQSLVRQEIDYGAMEDIARETWEQFSWSHLIRAFLIWTAIFFASLALYWRLFP